MLRIISLFIMTLAATNARAADDALDEVNKARAARGLPQFKRDDGLTTAAKNCADVRARNLWAGHCQNDYNALPAGVTAGATGCAAWEPSMGWGSCCTYENWTYAGAAVTTGRDGIRYMHLFVR
jgi:Cysteine-rich secretory protein family